MTKDKRSASPDNTLASAGLPVRAIAYSIDCAFAFLLFAITQLLVFTPFREAVGISESWFHVGTNTELYTLATVSIPVVLLFAVFDSSSWRGTPGKKMLRLNVLGTNDKTLPLRRSILRTIIKLLPWELAHIGNNLPTPIWYADNPGIRVASLAALILLAIYVVFLALNSKQLALHDIISGSKVVRHNEIRIKD